VTELAAAHGRTIPDVLPRRGDPPLSVLFCGINPSLYSAATGWHFARPGNRFWPALHLAGFTPCRLHPSEQQVLLQHGIGITNLVARATAKASELSDEELRAGVERLTRLAERYRPRVVAVAGIAAYRVGFGRPAARTGPQDRAIAGTALWVVPNPSGLNAHYRLAELAEEFERLRRHVEGAVRTSGP